MSNVAELPAPRRNNGAELVASNVRALLAYNGRTQAQLAFALGVSEMHISRRTSGHTEFKASEIVSVANYFNVEPGALFEERGGGVGPVELESTTSSVESREFAGVVLPFARRGA